jgi:hypothetical protein
MAKSNNGKDSDLTWLEKSRSNLLKMKLSLEKRLPLTKDLITTLVDILHIKTECPLTEDQKAMIRNFKKDIAQYLQSGKRSSSTSSEITTG